MQMEHDHNLGSKSIDNTSRSNDEQDAIPIQIQSQEQVIATIREWLRLDQQMARMKKDMKDMGQRKRRLTQDLTQTMMQRKIDSYAIKNGELVYKTKKSKQAISKKYLMQQLHAYYVDDEEEADNVVNLLLTNRKTTVTTELCCKLDTAGRKKNQAADRKPDNT